MLSCLSSSKRLLSFRYKIRLQSNVTFSRKLVCQEFSCWKHKEKTFKSTCGFEARLRGAEQE